MTRPVHLALIVACIAMTLLGLCAGCATSPSPRLPIMPAAAEVVSRRSPPSRPLAPSPYDDMPLAGGAYLCGPGAERIEVCSALPAGVLVSESSYVAAIEAEAGLRRATTEVETMRRLRREELAAYELAAQGLSAELERQRIERARDARWEPWWRGAYWVGGFVSSWLILKGNAP